MTTKFRETTDAEKILSRLTLNGIKYLTGVPCSILTPLINLAIDSDKTKYILASSEGDALAIASGIWLGGGLAAVLCQNSGLGNMVNPLTSLNDTFQIPSLLMITWRGRPGSLDEPQHQLMGEITQNLLSLLNIPFSVIPPDWKQAQPVIDLACSYLQKKEKPYALLIPDGSIRQEHSATNENLRDISTIRMSRLDAIRQIVSAKPKKSVLVATTGKTGRMLFSIGEKVSDFYCVGSMGYANALGHGIALVTNRQIIVIDGDGAALMHLGNLTSVGASTPSNYTHIILDNGVYDSTGGQLTASSNVDFLLLARACGYKTATKCETPTELANAVRRCGGPHLLHVPIKICSEPVGRPTTPPYNVAQRLRNLLCGKKTK